MADPPRNRLEPQARQQTLRSKHYRARRRKGKQVLDVEVDTDLVAEAMIRAGMSKAEAKDRKAVEDELGRMIWEWAMWKCHRNTEGGGES